MRFIVLAIVLLITPVGFVLLRNDVFFGGLSALLAATGFGLLTYAVARLSGYFNKVLAAVVAAILLVTFLFIRVVFAGLYDFSGRGFTSEFFGHIEPKSFQVAMGEYGLAFLVLFIVLGLTAFGAARLINRQASGSVFSTLLVLPVAFGLIWSGSAASPEVLLARAYQHYYHRQFDYLASEGGRTQAAALLTPLRQSAGVPVERDDLQVNLPDRPVNLILVYLESFNEALTGSERHPGLTPRLDELKNRYQSDRANYSSAYVTIEGIANSQCGTLLNMEYANNSLTTEKGRLPALPCLGDILRAAGYTQVYLGGADLEFAGKGAFLEEHGYDEVLGWKHWVDGGYKQTGDLWGLPDSILFDEALARVQKLHAGDAPFNLTLLTLGTHIPGFQYEGCPAYPGSTNEPFLNGVHCTDHLVGKFVDQLEERGLMEDTVLYIQGDHGVFNNPEMKRLFPDVVEDRRVLTIMAIPERLKDRYKFEEQTPIASLDTVATLLDVMQVEHNVDFILARSKFDKTVSDAYLLTRYYDYYRSGSLIRNNPDLCDDHDRTGGLTLPLDHCDKKRALQAVYALDASYALGSSVSNHACDLAVEAYKFPQTGEVHVRWGNRDLTDQFNSIGRAVSSGAGGVFLLLLDSNDEILQQQFFAADSAADLGILQETLQTLKAGQHFLMMTNERAMDRQESISDLWPELLQDNYLVYGSVGPGSLNVELADSNPDFAHRFYPSTCIGGLKSLAFEPPYRKSFCKVTKWGPKRTYVGERFNEQPDGRSAFWFKTQCSPKNLSVQLHGEAMATYQVSGLVTAAMDADHLLQKPAEYGLEFHDPDLGNVQVIGSFSVLPAKTDD